MHWTPQTPPPQRCVCECQYTVRLHHIRLSVCRRARSQFSSGGFPGFFLSSFLFVFSLLDLCLVGLGSRAWYTEVFTSFSLERREDHDDDDVDDGVHSVEGLLYKSKKKRRSRKGCCCARGGAWILDWRKLGLFFFSRACGFRGLLPLRCTYTLSGVHTPEGSSAVLFCSGVASYTRRRRRKAKCLSMQTCRLSK